MIAQGSWRLQQPWLSCSVALLAAVAFLIAGGARGAELDEAEAFSASQARQPPHMFLVVIDDLGHSDVGLTGSGIHTPVLDSLAAGGIIMDSYYVQSKCSPSRAAMQTGRYELARLACSPLWRGMQGEFCIDHRSHSENEPGLLFVLPQCRSVNSSQHHSLVRPSAILLFCDACFLFNPVTFP